MAIDGLEALDELNALVALEAPDELNTLVALETLDALDAHKPAILSGSTGSAHVCLSAAASVQKSANSRLSLRHRWIS